VLVRGNVVGVGLAALTLAVNEVVLVRGNVVGVGLAALTLAFNEGVLVGSYVVGVGLAALTLAVNEGVLVLLGERELVENVFESGDALELLAGGEAGEKDRHGKHDECYFLEILHFSVLSVFCCA
jgi:hypothetical protein